MLARDGLRGEPIATPSISRCIILLTLNSTEEVAVCISLTKIARVKGGGVSSPLYRTSAQISIVSASGTLVKGCRRHRSRETTDGGKLKVLTLSAKAKKSETQWVE